MALAILALASVTAGLGILLSGALWEIQETLTIDGQPAEIREDGYVDPGRIQAVPNQTIELTYTLHNPRPMAWEGPVHVYADTLDGARQPVDHVYVERTIELAPRAGETVEIQVVPRELGYTEPRPEGYRCACFSVVIEGPGPDHQLRVILDDDERGGRPR